MGRRARTRGFSNAMGRAVKAASQARDEDAARIADTVYATAVTWRENGKPIQFAPAVVTASWLAVAACEAAGVEATRENLTDVTSMLIGAMEDEAGTLTGEKLVAYRERFNLSTREPA